jgi:competence protein ComGF
LAKEVKNNVNLLKTSLVVVPPQFVLFAIFLLVLLKGSKEKFAEEFLVVINDLRLELSKVKSAINDVQSKDVEQLIKYIREFFLKTKSLTQTDQNKDDIQEEV